MIPDFPRNYDLLRQPIVSSSDTELDERHFWIAFGTEEQLTSLMKKKDAAYPVKYSEIKIGQCLVGFGGWKISRPVPEIPFPAITIDIGRWDSAAAWFAAALTKWLLNLQKYTNNRNYIFKVVLGDLNTVTVEFDE